LGWYNQTMSRERTVRNLSKFSYRREVRIPGGYARAFEVERGSLITVTDVEGGQVADLIAFNRDRVSERLSPSHTRLALHSVKLKVDDDLRSNLRRPMLKVIADGVGTHDLLIPACDEQRYWVDYGVREHRSCVANFEDALIPWEIPRELIPDPLNIFENSSIEPDGSLVHLPVISRPGDCLALRALMPLVCAVSSCPMDLNVTGGERITDILVVIEHEV
jgi:uncharacterized protein YcgI (DUF1989 family)